MLLRAALALILIATDESGLIGLGSVVKQRGAGFGFLVKIPGGGGGFQDGRGQEGVCGEFGEFSLGGG